MIDVPAHTLLFWDGRRHPYCVVIPVVDEGERLRRLLGRIVALGLTGVADVLVVDGGSADGSTADAALRARGVVGSLCRVAPGGLGTQLRIGYAFAMNQGYEGVVTIDGNDKDDPEGIARVLAALKQGNDLVQASRFVPGGHAQNTPMHRWLAIRAVHAPLLSWMSGFHWTDTTQGFRGYSRRLLLDPRLALFRPLFSHYELLPYVSYAAPRLGLRCVEVPSRRTYPPGAVPTRIRTAGAHLQVLGALLQACAGRFGPVAPGKPPALRSAWWREAALVAVLVALGLYHWLPDGLPGWLTPQDQLIDGLDAGEWADQARAYNAGQYGALDGHRMPTWTFLSGLLAGLGVPVAGHVVNHLLQVALGPVIYGLGRAWGMGRGASLFAGALVASNAVLVLASRRFGVDPTLTTLLPLCLLAAHTVRVRWWLGGVAGSAAAFCAASHFTTLAYPVPVALSVLILAASGERLRAGFAFGLGSALTWVALFQVFPWIGMNQLLQGVAESASHEAAGVPGMPDWGTLIARALQAARTELGGALVSYVGRIHAGGAPALLVAALVVLGVSGVGLEDRQPGAPAQARRPGWLGGGVLLLALGPLPVLLSMRAADRYTDNGLPIATLLAVRGVAVLLAALPRSWRGVGDGVVGALLAIWAAFPTLRGIPPSGLETALIERDVGALLSKFVPPGGCVVSPMREAVAYADVTFVRTGCPDAPTEGAFRSCLASLRWQCPGQETLYWVVFERTPLDERHAALKAMDAWAVEGYPVVARAAVRDAWSDQMDAWAVEGYPVVGNYRSHAIHVWVVKLPL
ncbi:MAG: glycosyltransferase family 2 protein [Myxococcales bacterium]|nr:glycosyltransferase family 2 protein [Myxococcales bacterium]